MKNLRKTAVRPSFFLLSYVHHIGKAEWKMLPEKIAFVLTLLLRLFGLWFLVMGLFFWKRPRPYPASSPRTRFACLIPARNEEAVIGAAVRSLKDQNYPSALFDVYVLPNNCTDGTEEAARAAGARILRCSGPVRNKGDVLRQALLQLLRADYDAFCVFDADNVVDGAFLARMNDAFQAGARVAKGRMLSKNPYDSWVSGCYALYNGLTETFFNRPRAALGLSAKLVGTGFAVHRDLLLKMGGWNTETIAEDAEFSAMCAALGERVRWVPEAVTYDEAPRSFAVSLTQRRRWVSGIMAVCGRKLPLLLRALPGGSLPRTVDAILFLCVPFFQAFSLLPPILLAVSAALRGALPSLLLPALPALLGSWLCLSLLAAALSRHLGMEARRSARAILLFPLFMASWLPLQVVSLLHPARAWKEIRHGAPPLRQSLSAGAR